MIVLDTHVWVWWAQGDAKLPRAAAERIELEEASGIGISAISCWEIAKLVEHDRLALPLPVEEWLTTALSYPGMELVPISPRIAVESTQLPGEFHNDPADHRARAQLCSVDRRLQDSPLSARVDIPDHLTPSRRPYWRASPRWSKPRYHRDAEKAHNSGLVLTACLLRARRCRALAARTAAAQPAVGLA